MTRVMSKSELRAKILAQHSDKMTRKDVKAGNKGSLASTSATRSSI